MRNALFTGTVPVKYALSTGTVPVNNLSLFFYTNFCYHDFKDQKFFWTQNYLWPTIFFTLIFSGPKWFGPFIILDKLFFCIQIFLDWSYFLQRYFYPKLFYPKLFWTQIFLDPNFFGTRFYRSQQKSRNKNKRTWVALTSKPSNFKLNKIILG